MRRLLPAPPIPNPARHHTALWRAVLALAAAIASQGGAHAEEHALGRLFFTPERRAALDRQRHLNVEEARVVEGAKLTLNGVVRRSGGKSTVWINGVPYDDHAPSAEMQSRIDRHDPSRVTLKAGDEAPSSLKVGESINRATGEKQDGLDGGYVRVRPMTFGGGRSQR
jgi:hypothetical protein